jgi:hypothetical protein
MRLFARSSRRKPQGRDGAGEVLARLYEQQKRAPQGALILGKYVTRWLRWTRAGLWELDRGCLPLTPTRQTESSQTAQDEPDGGRYGHGRKIGSRQVILAIIT